MGRTRHQQHTTIRTTSTPILLHLLLLFCLPGGSLAQWAGPAVVSSGSVNTVASFLNKNCGHLASFLPKVCGIYGAISPACCGLFIVVDLCRASCGGNTNVLYGAKNQELQALMYSPDVCPALELAGQSECQGYNAWSPPCEKLKCLLNMMCLPNYNFACFQTPAVGATYNSVSSGSNPAYLPYSSSGGSGGGGFAGGSPSGSSGGFSGGAPSGSGGVPVLPPFGTTVPNVGAQNDPFFTTSLPPPPPTQPRPTQPPTQPQAPTPPPPPQPTTTPRPQANENNLTSVIQSSCFEVPELGDSELTGLTNDSESALKKCPQHVPDPACGDPKKLIYRTLDGSCNNLENPNWGKSFEPQKRYLPPVYNDQVGFPRSRGVTGVPLPNPRLVSATVVPMEDHTAGVSNMVMAWGQFIDHDFTGTPMIKNGSMSIKCCGNISSALLVQNGGPCFPITIPPGDTLGRPCMQFVRSLSYMFPNGSAPAHREQLNVLTAFLDGSAVYGNTQEELKTLAVGNGSLLVGPGNHLPENVNGTCKKEAPGDYCLNAGDQRVNVFVGLGALHTTFVREHNRLVDALKALNPHWSADKLFEEARRIVSAEFQRITYGEWLPLVLGDVTMSTFGLKENDPLYQYKPEVNPTIANVFSTAAFRFGHSQVKQVVQIGSQVMMLQDTLMRPRFTLQSIRDIYQGLLQAPTDVVDRFIVVGLTNHMFETNTTAKDGLDLVSLNIQRGRDHGLPAYNEYRVFCGLPRLTSLSSNQLTGSLAGVYSHVDDIDIFVGLIMEPVVPGTLVGPTLGCLLGQQFQDMKYGDRFFYETTGVNEKFTADQLREIKRVTLARVICDNVPDLTLIQPDVFNMASASRNPQTSCSNIPGIELKYWRDGTTGQPQASQQNQTAIILDNCFELPTLADGELTGLINDSQSATRKCPDHGPDPVCNTTEVLFFRTIDGSCNNLVNVTWGRAFELQKRHLPPVYNDQVGFPRSLARSGHPLPNARSVSVAVCPMSDHTVGFSNMIMAWGQFIDHDTTGTPMIKNGSKSIKCCGDIPSALRVENGGPCFTIPIPPGDKLNRPCMEFVRSLPMFKNGVRQQLNSLTAFVDASAVYGSTQETLDTLVVGNGSLRVRAGNMLPENENGTCVKERAADYCLHAGDQRVNVFVGLGALHTTFVREHNRLVDELKIWNPHWSAERLFQEARRLVGAMFQRVTYTEWLPLLLGDELVTRYGLKEKDPNYRYDPTVNPTIANVFSTAAFRFGHSMVKSSYQIGSQTFALQDTLMRPRFALQSIRDIFQALLAAPNDELDHFVTEGLTNHLFETNNTATDRLDLIALNIQRGRDHGLPPYNDFRAFCGLPRLTSLSNSEWTVPVIGVYESIDDVDIFIGLVMEKTKPGALVGPTLGCLLGQQFRDLKYGDRFFYETNTAQERFTDAQLNQIKRITLAKIICENNPDIITIQSNVFRLPDTLTNSRRPCSAIPGINLFYWREAP